jgi:drug/metabolite transporter (DMT)-like permease
MTEKSGAFKNYLLLFIGIFCISWLAVLVKIAIICGVLFASDIALWNTSIMLSKASISTLLANLAPIWVGLAALFFMKEKPGKIFWFGTYFSNPGIS